MIEGLFTVAVNLTRQIIHMVQTYNLQDVRFKELGGRVAALEQPLLVLQENADTSKAVSINDEALRKLVGTLEMAQKLLEEQAKTSLLNKAKKFATGDAKITEYTHINTLLDSSLLDLQLALQVEQAASANARVEQTAQSTVDILLASHKAAMEETIHECVQCGKEFRNSENPEGACKYHAAIPKHQSWDVLVECCGKKYKDEQQVIKSDDACKRGSHRSAHHTDYYYSSYTLWARETLKNVKENWLKLSIDDHEDHSPKWASVGTSADGKIVVGLGRGYYPLFAKLYDPLTLAYPKDPKAIQGNIIPVESRSNTKTWGEEPKTYENNMSWIASASWLVNSFSKSVTGVQLQVKSLSLKDPVIKEQLFTLKPLAKGQLRVVSDVPSLTDIQFGGALPKCEPTTFKPFPPHIFEERPEPKEVECTLNGPLKMRIKQVGTIAANPTSNRNMDTFVIEMLVMNLANGGAAGSSSEERMEVLGMLKTGKVNVTDAIKLLSTLDGSPRVDGPANIIDIRCRFFVDNEWQPAAFTQVKPAANKTDIGSVPFEVPPRSAQKLSYECKVKTPAKADCRGGTMFDRAYCARLAPIKIEITLEEMSGHTCVALFEYHSPSYAKFFTVPKKVPEEALMYLYVDSLSQWCREHVSVNKAANDKNDPLGPMLELQYAGYKPTIDFATLQKWGYAAVKQNTPVMLMKDLGNEDVKVWSLVDLKAGVVCGFKFRVAVGADSAESIYMIPKQMLTDAANALMKKPENDK